MVRSRWVGGDGEHVSGREEKAGKSGLLVSTWRSSLMTGTGPVDKRGSWYILNTLCTGEPGLLMQHRKEKRASIEDSLKKNGKD